ncbi:MAG: NAD(P)-dependent glycerol-3-phosphate dehydrogenase [Clostridia bacterium]|nr:NAD(P)-dependent glycerol-3-phosphate dehydrogenase [Clostridia bacterium]
MGIKDIGKTILTINRGGIKLKKIAIIGSGSWGVALATHLARCGNKVNIWSFSEQEKEQINKERKCKFLPDLVVHENITCSTNFEEVIQGAEFILHVTPSKFTRDTFKQYKQYVEDKPVIICSKGFEKESLKTLDEVILEELPTAKVGVLSGPSHAEEVSIAVPTVLVIASKHDEILTMIQNSFMCNEMRIYTSEDVKGVELGGALKNIIAFCAGVAAGIGLGDNSFAALITRGLNELTRLGVKLGGEKETFYGLSGLGDLIVTCLSEHSRNRRAGKLIGQGKTLEETKKEVGMVIESIDNIEVAYQLCKIHKIDMPIVEAVYQVIYENLDPQEAVKKLMTRNKKSE